MKRKFSSSKVEWTYIGQLINAVENKNIKNLLSNALLWYIIKAKTYKVFEYLLNIVTLIVPILVVIINNHVEADSIGEQMGVAIVGIMAAATRFFSKIHEKRVEYRVAAERIKCETGLYINEVGEYKGQDRDEKFIKAIIEIRENENRCWEKMEKRGDFQTGEENSSRYDKTNNI